MTLRAIVVDDEPLARAALRSLLGQFADVTVVAECANGYEACAAIGKHRPDVLFLDIAMPELDGFATLERLEPEDVSPAVVFVTAFDAHALRAFEARALDYIMKPVTPERLAAAVDRAGRRVRESRALRDALDLETAGATADGHESRTGVGAGMLTRLVVRDHRGTTVVPVDDLEWIEGATYYVRLHRRDRMCGRELLLRERMHVLELRLDGRLFFRTHRSAIVRLDCVREIGAAAGYETFVVLASGARAPLSRDRRARLELLLAAPEGTDSRRTFR
jgi:two-component system LytT family response regulator